MCELCPLLEEGVLLAAVEQEVILLESASGNSIDGAIRALLPHERAAKVRFGDIQALLAAAVEAWAPALETLWATIRRVLETLPPSAGDMLEQLGAWVNRPPAQVQAALRAAESHGVKVLDTVVTGGVDLVNAEAKRQGVGRAATPELPGTSSLSPIAGLAGAYLWDQVTTRLQKATTPATVLQNAPLDVIGVLGQQPLDGVMDQARQAVHAAHGAGRIAAQKELGVSAAWASEILDGKTCGPCSRVDGREYATLEDAEADYPGGGGYAGCLGTGRCRGTLVVLYQGTESKPVKTPGPPVDPFPSTPFGWGAFKYAPVSERNPFGLPERGARNDWVSTQTLDATRFVKGSVTVPQDLVVKAAAPDWDRDLPKLPAPMDGKRTAELVNPNFATSKGYQFNCTVTSTVWELRRRGLDVTATQTPPQFWKMSVEGVAWRWVTAEGKHPVAKQLTSKKALLTHLASLPEGARGTITVRWRKSNGGHAFVWENTPEGVKFWEPQNPDKGEVSEYLDRVKYQGETNGVWVLRVDDLVPSEAMIETIQEVAKSADIPAGSRARRGKRS